MNLDYSDLDYLFKVFFLRHDWILLENVFCSGASDVQLQSCDGQMRSHMIDGITLQILQ